MEGKRMVWNYLKKALLILPLIFTHNLVSAAEKGYVCAKYKTSEGWSKLYAVESTTLTGTELVAATGRYEYTETSLYVVIFWKPSEASVIKMDNYELYDFAFIKGVDQSDTDWEIRKTYGKYCY